MEKRGTTKAPKAELVVSASATETGTTDSDESKENVNVALPSASSGSGDTTKHGQQHEKGSKSKKKSGSKLKTSAAALAKKAGNTEVVQVAAIKHPLNFTWRLWCLDGTSTAKVDNWQDALKDVSSFATVEEFWSVQEHIISASELIIGSSYFMFKDGIKPMWEDDANRLGGRWFISLDRRLRSQLDVYWQEILMCLVGEAFGDDGDGVCGAVFDNRYKGYRISVWTADWQNRRQVVEIGRIIEERLGDIVRGSMIYEQHDPKAGFQRSLYVR